MFSRLSRFVTTIAIAAQLLLQQGRTLGQAVPATSGYTKSQKYLDHPAVGDRRCRQDIARATQDLQRGRRVFCWPKTFSFTYVPRYATELTNVCQQHGIRFEYELISDETSPGFTEGCYGAIMDRALARQFGKGFRARWIAQADSLFKSRHPAVRTSAH